MSDQLIKVSHENLFHTWVRVEPYVEKVLNIYPDYSLSDIYMLVKSGVFTLWMFYNEDDNKPFGAMVTELINHPQRRLMSIFLMSCDDFKRIVPLWPVLYKDARNSGAVAIECAGRFGLEKILPQLGFKKDYIVMSTEVK